jgi:hypothetical protein
MGRLDPSRERRAPRLPTPISFPDPIVAIEKETRAWSAESPPDIESLLQLWQYWPPKKNQRYGREMWETINVTFRPPEKIDDVVGGVGVWTPPPSWLDEPTAEERTQVRHSRALSNGRLDDQDPPTLFNTRSWPTRKDFYDKVSELKYTNLDGFRGLIRQKVEDKPPPRVAQSRTFYKCLDDVVQFWDTSLDEYILPEDADNSTTNSDETMNDAGAEDEPRKRARLAPCEGDRNGTADGSTGVPDEPEPAAPPREIRRGPWTKRKLTPPPSGTYRGWRIDAGRHMPPEMRDGVVKALLDMAIWPFHLHVDEQDRAPPRLALGTARVGVPLTRRVWRNALTRTEVRVGVKRGPALGVSCRQHVDFAGERPVLGEADLARELGALLLLAQERRREGREERRPGAGKWWDEVPRFAGMEYEVPGEYRWGEAGGDGGDGDGDGDEAAARAKRALTEKLKRRGPAPSDMTPRERAINAYKLFLPGPPLWDPKVKYSAIGKPKGGYDEVRSRASISRQQTDDGRSSSCRR